MAQNRHPPTNNILTRSRPQGALAFLATIVILGLIGWVYLRQASEAAELQHRIQALRQQEQELQRQNDQLAYEIARLASVDQLNARARQLGYVAVSQARFVAVAGYPSHQESAPDETMTLAQRDPAGRATPSAVAGWWKTFTGQFEAWAQSEQP